MKPCTMGVGCDEAGMCYAAAHGQPEQCPREPNAWDDLFAELAVDNRDGNAEVTSARK